MRINVCNVLAYLYCYIFIDPRSNASILAGSIDRLRESSSEDVRDLNSTMKEAIKLMQKDK